MEKDLVSVITLSFNNFENYQECIDSIFKQNYPMIEWILSDDDSTEFESWKAEIMKYILNVYGDAALKNIQIHKNAQNVGVIKNYKNAIDIANGEYIFYLAMGDCFYDDNVIKDMVEYFSKTDLDFFGGCWEWIPDDGEREIRPPVALRNFWKKKTSAQVYEHFLRYPMLMGACTPFRRELVDRYGFLDDSYRHLEDWPRYLDWLSKGVKGGFYDRILIRYYDGGITSKKITDKDMLRDLTMVIDRNLKSHLMPDSIWKAKQYVLAWGAGGGFLKNYKAWEKAVGRKCDYIIDGDPKKQGTTVAGRKIISLDDLKQMKKDDVYILIFSRGYYFEIIEELEKMGFELKKHYELISRELLLWKCGGYDEE